MTKERPDTPNWLISTAEIFQDLIAINGLANLVTGSKSPAYERARWRPVDQVVDINGNKVSLPIADADPDASLLTSIFPRLKDQVAVAVSGYFDMEEILEKNNAMPAVAYTYKGKTHAGLLWHRSLGIEHVPSISQPMNTSATRVGRNKFGAGHGGLIPAERVLVLPRDLAIVRQKMAIEDLEKEFPNTPLV